MDYFKRKVNYQNMNNIKYDSNSVMGDPDSIQKELKDIQSNYKLIIYSGEMQTENLGRNHVKMLYSEKLLNAMQSVKTPSVRSIYK